MAIMTPNQCAELSGPILRIANIGQRPPLQRSPLVASALVHILFAVLIFSVAAPESMRRVTHVVVPLFSPAPEPKRIPATRRMSTLVAPAPPPFTLTPRISAPVPVPQPLPEAPAPQTSPASKLPHAPAAVPVIEAPQQARPAPPVATGVFSAANSTPTAPAGSSKLAVQTGSFQPSGTQTPATSQASVASAGFGRPEANAAAALPRRREGQTGSFQSANRDSGTASRAQVASTGFGSPVAIANAPRLATTGQSGFTSMEATPVHPTARPKVSAVPFEAVIARPTTGPAGAKPVSRSSHSPLEILDKPRPAYSQEARRLQIEGEVVLEVLFRAAGQIRVVRVVHSLGHGLDESAIQAAGAIRFRPATENGKTLDTVAVVRIAFQLAY